MPPINVDIVEDSYEDKVDQLMVEAESLCTDAAFQKDHMESEDMAEIKEFPEVVPLNNAHNPHESSTEQEPLGEVVKNENIPMSPSIIVSESPAISMAAISSGMDKMEKLQFLETYLSLSPSSSIEKNNWHQNLNKLHH